MARGVLAGARQAKPDPVAHHLVAAHDRLHRAYVAALGRITSSLTTALFSVTPALVVLLAVPLLGRRLTPFSVLACALAAAH